MKRILILGGSFAQLPFIVEAKKRGYYTILVDYLDDNPSQAYADEYYNLSTTDKEAVLELALKVKPDAVFSYASDPAALTVAYVSEKLDLPGNSYESVKLLSEKDLFRNLMFQNGFNCPKVLTISEDYKIKEFIDNLEFPVIVKPTDSSGSKGVSRVDNKEVLQEAIEYAITFSRNRKVIIEEFIDNDIADIHGDGFVIDGKLAFSCLGDHIYNGQVNPFNPTGTFWPSKLPEESVRRIESDVDKIIQLSGFSNGPINIEARINHKEVPYVMEIGPRNGGHFVPKAIQYATGFDMLSASFDLIEGRKIVVNENKAKPSAYIALHSEEDGVLEKVEISNKIQPFIKEQHEYVKIGSPVKSFQGANAAVGILLLAFSSIQEMDYYISNINKYVKIKLQ